MLASVSEALFYIWYPENPPVNRRAQQPPANNRRAPLASVGGNNQPRQTEKAKAPVTPVPNKAAEILRTPFILGSYPTPCQTPSAVTPYPPQNPQTPCQTPFATPMSPSTREAGEAAIEQQTQLVEQLRQEAMQGATAVAAVAAARLASASVSGAPLGIAQVRALQEEIASIVESSGKTVHSVADELGALQRKQTRWHQRRGRAPASQPPSGPPLPFHAKQAAALAAAQGQAQGPAGNWRQLGSAAAAAAAAVARFKAAHAARMAHALKADAEAEVRGGGDCSAAATSPQICCCGDHPIDATIDAPVVQTRKSVRFATETKEDAATPAMHATMLTPMPGSCCAGLASPPAPPASADAAADLGLCFDLPYRVSVSPSSAADDTEAGDEDWGDFSSFCAAAPRPLPPPAAMSPAAAVTPGAADTTRLEGSPAPPLHPAALTTPVSHAGAAAATAATAAAAAAAATASSLMMLGPDELDQWLSRRRTELQAAQQAASLTSGGRAAPLASVARRQLTPHPRASAPPMTPEADEGDSDGDGDGEEAEEETPQQLMTACELSPQPPTVQPVQSEAAVVSDQADESARLRMMVAELQAQLQQERTAKARLRQACVVCPECDQMVALCPQTKAITPHRCTPGRH